MNHTLTNLLAIALIAFFSTGSAVGQIMFEEDFQDGDISDGQPVRWVTRDVMGGEYEVAGGD